MTDQERQVVTGAFGYTGKYIASRLLQDGYRVRTLTNSVHRENPFGGRVEVYPFNFDHVDALVDSLRGATVLYNTYWVRFNYRSFDHASAVANTLKLFGAAVQAGVKRIVHVSITNPSEDSDLEYFQGKAVLERALTHSGLSYAILRPAVIFGQQDILINNIAWVLRQFPAIGIFGDGLYRLQPIYVGDLAELALQQGRDQTDRIINAIGPETFAYRDLVLTLADILKQPKPVVYMPPWMGYLAGWGIGKMVGDVLITRDEIDGLMRDLLYVDAPPAGKTRLTDWAKAHADTLGVRYASELARRANRKVAYDAL
jgi:uncharacterized protein YbjT (DUF2867 family)